MRIWMRRGLAAVLVMALLCSGSVVFATETEPETWAEETAEPETVPEETEPSETEAPTEAPAGPELPEPYVYTVDTESDIYILCDSLSEGMVYDQLLVFELTYVKLDGAYA